MSKSLTEYRLEQKFQTRLYVCTGIIISVAVILCIRLGDLQIYQGTENRVLAKKFVSRQEFTIAPRGLMYDRNYESGGAPLVYNINYIDFVIYPGRFTNLQEGEAFIRQFCNIMGKDFAEFADIVDPVTWKSLVRKNESVTLLTRMTRREHERLAELNLLTKYGEFATNHLRYYAMGPALAHVTGYIGLPSRRELDRKLALPYQMIGKGGLEARYDSELRGTDGIRIRHRVVDAEEEIAQSEQGSHLVLSIDKEIQAVAYRSLLRSGKRGGVVVLRPTTGEIVAMVSHPSYDPNILASATSEQRTAHFEQVETHQGFLNLAIQTKFPPASSFKPLVALSMMESANPEKLNENTTFFCPGKWVLKSSLAGVPPTEFYCWEHRGHGQNDLIGALAHSCNVYFYNLGYRLGPTPIIHFARAFNLDKKTGIDLPGEATGFVPDQNWKLRTWSSRWYDGDTVNLSIGQGFLETTPIEIAALYGALANRGKMYRPHLVNEIRDPVTNRVLRRIRPELTKEVPLSAKGLDVVLRGMRAVVTNGTSRFLNAPGYPPIAGKTGTVQTRSGRQGRSHAWFAGFAPFDAPPEDRLVAVVFVEFGMGGSLAAAPVAGDIFKAAFPNYQSKNAPIFVPQVNNGTQNPVQLPGTNVNPNNPGNPVNPSVNQ